MNRREWLYGVGLAAGASAVSHVGVADAVAAKTPKAKPLDLSQFEPKSMLQVHETQVDKAKFPVIDFHTHISVAAKSKNGVELVAEGTKIRRETVARAISRLERRGLITTMTRGSGTLAST